MSFTPLFRVKTRSVHRQARQYVQGLMQAGRKNMERMAEVVPGSDDQSLQHFLSNSGWDASAVMGEITRRADAALGPGEKALVLDESAIPKKGRKSVGVARQWCGRLGKVDNCQVGVFSSLVSGTLSTLISARLFLPRSWTDDPERCEGAGVPVEHQVYKSKSALALELVQEARDQGASFDWVGADSGYGKEPAFLRELDDRGEVFVVDVHKDQRVFVEDPKPTVPPPTGKRGRPPSRRIPRLEDVRVDTWAEQQPPEEWKPVEVRKGTRGLIRAEVLHRRIWVWDGTEASARCWHLLVSRNETGSLSYTLSNAAQEMTREGLAYRQHQRFWVERSFQDAKSESGLADYQARGWRAWHHHMALVMMALLFMLEERIRQAPENPLLSCSDVETLLAHFLARKAVTKEEVLDQMRERHRRRQAAIDSRDALDRCAQFCLE